MKTRQLEKVVQYLRRKRVLNVSVSIHPDQKVTILGYRQDKRHDIEIGKETVKVTVTSTDWL
jgi:hypothetical protein